MGFNTRTQFITAQSSEKMTLAHVEARSRLYEWTVYSGSIYQKTVPYFVIGLKQNDDSLVAHTTNVSLPAGKFFYNTVTGILYAHFNGSVNPNTIEAIVTYRFFYASGPCTLSYDLTNTGNHVAYEGRILSSPGYNHKIGIDQDLTSIVGSGNLKLENTDSGLDNKFDTLLYENRDVTIYSWHRDLAFESARVIYRGKITNKTYDSQSVTFTIKDDLFNLEQALPLQPYTDEDNVNDDIKGRYKRRVYGRVDGLKLQSVDQIGNGYLITGTVSASAQSATLNGTGTSFLSETSPGDDITIGTQEFTISEVVSDIEITLDNETTFAFIDQSATLVPEIPTNTKNREFFVAGHACSNLTYTVEDVIQLNRIQLSNTTGLSSGDFIEFENTERKEIKNIAPGNIVVLRSNIIDEPDIGSVVIRQPIQKVYKEGKVINSDNFTINNLGSPDNKCTITLADDVEFNLAKATILSFSLTFTNGSRSCTTADDVDLRDILSPRDWIRPDDITYTTYYEVLSVSETSLELRINFADPTTTEVVQAKLPDYIDDDTILSAEVIGKTTDGEPEGEWIRTAAQMVRDVISSINISDNNVNETSFADAKVDANQTISLALPLNPEDSSVTAKEAIDLINQSVFGSLTLDNDLKLKYKIIQMDTPEDPIKITDADLIRWSIKTTNGKNFRDSVVRYKHKDVDRITLEPGVSVKTFSSEFIRKYIETSKLKEFDAYLFNESDAEIFAQRQVYYNRVSRSDITLETDLRLENIEIGDVVQLEMKRLYDRLGAENSKKKLAIVMGKSVTGESVKFELSDIGNLYNSSAIIAPNDTNEYDSATEDEKLKWGFITDSQGIVNNDEDTANTNLIS